MSPDTELTRDFIWVELAHPGGARVIEIVERAADNQDQRQHADQNFSQPSRSLTRHQRFAMICQNFHITKISSRTMHRSEEHEF